MTSPIMMKTENNPNESAGSPVRVMVAKMAGLAGEGKSADATLADLAANWLAAQYLMAVHEKLEGEPPGGDDLEELRQCAADVARFQRGELQAAKLALDRARLAALIERDEAELEKEFWKFTRREKISLMLWPPGTRGRSERMTAMVAKAAKLM